MILSGRKIKIPGLNFFFKKAGYGLFLLNDPFEKDTGLIPQGMHKKIKII